MIAESVFLLPNGTFFVELLVVAVILFLVTKYILPPLNRAIESRQAKIRTRPRGGRRGARRGRRRRPTSAPQVLHRGARAGPRDRRGRPGAWPTRSKAEAGGRGQAEYERIVASRPGRDRHGAPARDRRGVGAHRRDRLRPGDQDRRARGGPEHPRGPRARGRRRPATPRPQKGSNELDHAAQARRIRRRPAGLAGPAVARHGRRRPDARSSRRSWPAPTCARC